MQRRGVVVWIWLWWERIGPERLIALVVGGTWTTKDGLIGSISLVWMLRGQGGIHDPSGSQASWWMVAVLCSLPFSVVLVATAYSRRHNSHYYILGSYNLHFFTASCNASKSTAAFAISSQNCAFGISSRDVIVNWRRSATVNSSQFNQSDLSLTIVSGHISYSEAVRHNLNGFVKLSEVAASLTHLSPAVYRKML